jgi:hypothetical protein
MLASLAAFALRCQLGRSKMRRSRLPAPWLLRFPKIPNFRTLENHVIIKLRSWNFAKLVYHCWTDGKKNFKLLRHREGGFLEPPFSVKLSCDEDIAPCVLSSLWFPAYRLVNWEINWRGSGRELQINTTCTYSVPSVAVLLKRLLWVSSTNAL